VGKENQKNPENQKNLEKQKNPENLEKRIDDKYKMYYVCNAVHFILLRSATYYSIKQLIHKYAYLYSQITCITHHIKNYLAYNKMYEYYI